MAVSDSDELYSLKAAFIVMLLLSLVSVVLRFGLNRPFFTPEFETALVYLPTIMLLSAWSWVRMRKPGV